MRLSNSASESFSPGGEFRGRQTAPLLPIEVVNCENECLGGYLGVGYLEVECFVEDRIQSLAMDFGFEFLLLIGKQIDLRVGR